MGDCQKTASQRFRRVLSDKSFPICSRKAMSRRESSSRFLRHHSSPLNALSRMEGRRAPSSIAVLAWSAFNCRMFVCIPSKYSTMLRCSCRGIMEGKGIFITIPCDIFFMVGLVPLAFALIYSRTRGH